MNDNQIKITVLTSLYRCERYLPSFFNYLKELKHTSNIEVLLLHNDPQMDEEDIVKNNIETLPFVKHIPILQRESLYQTWNRGIEAAKGEYICVWNVDDIRLPESIHEQSVTLDENPDSMLTYGDFYFMYKYGEPSTVFVNNPNYSQNKKTFLKKHHIGCFPMWRKALHGKIGYFDEQFRLVADFDFQIRTALNCKLVKTNSVLGYYLDNDPNKLSSNYILQTKERTLLYLRYAIFEYLDWIFVPSAIKSYKVREALYSGNYHRISLDKFFVAKRIYLLFISIFRQPRYILTYIKRGILNK
ncbi:MAG: glycosyltransferase family 2 protein [Dysgonomonas sp.]